MSGTKPHLTLGIETSCDETSVAIVQNGRRVLSCPIASFINDFQNTGGVIPEHAARRQLDAILPCLDQAFAVSGRKQSDLDLIAVTSGPGLLGSLLTGTVTARVLASVWKKPLIGVHHMQGHFASPWLHDGDETPEIPSFPTITLSVSGGHSEMWLRKSHTTSELIGATLDDAAGEAFDKGAKILGLGYPGGPAISKTAMNGDPEAFRFPRALERDPGLNFSFSGLKTSLKYLVRDLTKGDDANPVILSPTQIRGLAASYQQAICDHLARQVGRVLDNHPEIRELHLVGGVSANSLLRTMLGDIAKERELKFRTPVSIRFCTDNAAMIAAAGYFTSIEQPHMIGASFEACATCVLP